MNTPRIPSWSVRSSTLRLATGGLVLGVLVGCAPKEVTTEKPAIVETQSFGNFRKDAVDLNNDKKPDVWNYYSTEGRDRLVRKETDLNGDTKVDVTSHYENTILVKEEYDADFDERTDWIDFFNPEGKRVRQEWDTDFDGKPNVWKYFDEGKLVRKERDTDADFKPDYFEHYENGKVTRIGRDTNGDGEEDTWD